MGFFDSIFGGSKKEYAPLDQSSSAAQQLENLQQPLADFIQKTDDSFEVIPSDSTAYIFLGEPPKKFGITWIEQDGSIHNFKSLVEDKGVSEIKLQRMVGKLRDAYIDSKTTERNSATIGGKQVVVTPCADLADNIKQVIHETIG